MANKIIWDGLPSEAVIMAADTAGMLLTLADDGIGVSSEVANGVAANNTMMALELFIQSYAAAPDAGGYFEVHVVYKLDDTNYADGEAGDLATPNLSAATLVGVMAVDATDESMYLGLTGIPIAPFDFKVCIVNKTGQALEDGAPDTSTLKAFLYSLEVQ